MHGVLVVLRLLWLLLRLRSHVVPLLSSATFKEGHRSQRWQYLTFFSEALDEKGLARELGVGWVIRLLLRFEQGSDGKWEGFLITSPPYDQVEIHSDMDKGPRQARSEITTSRLAKLFEAANGEDRFCCRN